MSRQLRVEDHIGLVVSIAKRYSKACSHLTIDDLIQEGTIGLMVALERFDPSRGVAFSTYGTWWIKAKMRRAIANYEREVRIPCWVLERDSKAGELRRELTRRLDAAITVEGGSWHEIMADEGAASPEDACDRHEREQLARELLDALPKREREIIEQRVFDDRTLAEIGAARTRPVTRERIRQIEFEALARMRRAARVA